MAKFSDVTFGKERTGDLSATRRHPFLDRLEVLLQDTNVTDVHVTETGPMGPGRIWVRRKGDMKMEQIEVPREGIMSICFDLFRLPPNERENCATEFCGSRMRLRFSRSLFREQIFIRRLPSRIPTLAELGHERTFERLLSEIRPGIVLVAGPTGSGKSTLLASIMQHYLDTFPIHLVSAEDPVEYLLQPGTGEPSQREIPDDVVTFDKAVVNMLREDPDIVTIGEMREPSTAAAALVAAETGHLVFGTVHAPSVPGIVDRLYGMLQGVSDAPARFSQAFLGGVVLNILRDGKNQTKRTTEYMILDQLRREDADRAREMIRDRMSHGLSEFVQVMSAENRSLNL